MILLFGFLDWLFPKHLDFTVHTDYPQALATGVLLGVSAALLLYLLGSLMRSKLAPVILLIALGFGALVLQPTGAPPATPPQPPSKPAPPKKRPRLLLFTQSGCAPCEQQKKELAGVPFEEVRLPSPQARKFKIQATPTLVVVDESDKELARKEGLTSKAEVLSWLQGFQEAGGVVGSSPGKPVLGGKTSPDGKATIQIDLPASQKFHNQGGRDGAGLCVFASITWAARWSNERKAFDLFQKMRQEPGGGYPEKVDAMMKKYCAGAQYIQDTTGDQDLLETVLRTGRMAGVTYNGFDPHYSSSVSHMVTCVYFDRKTGWACISDNNFPGDEEFVWMSCEEFVKRWGANQGGWQFCWISPPPPPVPHN